MTKIFSRLFYLVPAAMLLVGILGLVSPTTLDENRMPMMIIIAGMFVIGGMLTVVGSIFAIKTHAVLHGAIFFMGLFLMWAGIVFPSMWPEEGFANGGNGIALIVFLTGAAFGSFLVVRAIRTGRRVLLMNE